MKLSIFCLGVFTNSGQFPRKALATPLIHALTEELAPELIDEILKDAENESLVQKFGQICKLNEHRAEVGAAFQMVCQLALAYQSQLQNKFSEARRQAPIDGVTVDAQFGPALYAIVSQHLSALKYVLVKGRLSEHHQRPINWAFGSDTGINDFVRAVRSQLKGTSSTVQLEINPLNPKGLPVVVEESTGGAPVDLNLKEISATIKSPGGSDNRLPEQLVIYRDAIVAATVTMGVLIPADLAVGDEEEDEAAARAAFEENLRAIIEPYEHEKFDTMVKGIVSDTMESLGSYAFETRFERLKALGRKADEVIIVVKAIADGFVRTLGMALGNKQGVFQAESFDTKRQATLAVTSIVGAVIDDEVLGSAVNSSTATKALMDALHLVKEETSKLDPTFSEPANTSTSSLFPGLSNFSMWSTLTGGNNIETVGPFDRSLALSS